MRGSIRAGMYEDMLVAGCRTIVKQLIHPVGGSAVGVPSNP